SLADLTDIVKKLIDYFPEMCDEPMDAENKKLKTYLKEVDAFSKIIPSLHALEPAPEPGLDGAKSVKLAKRKNISTNDKEKSVKENEKKDDKSSTSHSPHEKMDEKGKKKLDLGKEGKEHH